MSIADSLSSLPDKLTEDARFMILAELAGQADGHLNAISLRSILEMRYGVNRSPEWIETQLNKLTELGAVEARRGGAILIAQILPPGLDHLQGRTILAGVTRPRDFR